MGKGDFTWRLVVFSDDWGRHPSSCQHLVRHLLPRHPTLWVNTIGTRRPSLTWHDAGKVCKKLCQWTRADPTASVSMNGDAVPSGPSNVEGPGPGSVEGFRAGSPQALVPRIISPLMWPGFRTAWQRKLNAKLIDRAVRRTLARETDPALAAAPVVALTTLPITADLVGRLPVARWVYYGVDDFSVWPGTDAAVMDAMERAQAGQVDQVVVVSPTLQERLAGMGVAAGLLTHGIDLEHWSTQPAKSLPPDFPASISSLPKLPAWCGAVHGPIVLFWGLIDRRLDVEWCRGLAQEMQRLGGTLVLVGPIQDADPRLLALAPAPGTNITGSAQENAGGSSGIIFPGAVRYEQLPALAQWANVLVMPYADLPVTRAMQPLKFKEYLAAGWPDQGRPVVARALPSVRDWADAADMVETGDDLLAAVRRGLRDGLSAGQRQARGRLPNEGWGAKAAVLEAMLNPEGPGTAQESGLPGGGERVGM